jgi:hypothetical protein
MLSQLSVLLLTLIVTVAPVSRTVCEAMCSSRADAGKSQHSCHQAPSTGTHDAVSSQVHACGHGDELPVSASVTGGDQLTPAPAVFVMAAASIATPGLTRLARLAATSPPDRRSPLLPLRI